MPDIKNRADYTNTLMSQFTLTFTMLTLFCLWQQPALSANSLLSEYDPAVSVFLFQKKMAEKGMALAQYKLGMMYETGSGIPANLQTAKTWYRKAAEQHYKAAQNRLVFLEIKEKGYTEQYRDWLKNLRHDARYEDGEALFLLAQLYDAGIGVKQNKQLALKLLKKASAANIAGAESERLRIELWLQKEARKKEKTIVSAPRKKQRATKQHRETASERQARLLKRKRQLQQNAIEQQQQALRQYYQQQQKSRATPQATIIRTQQNQPPAAQDNNTDNNDICAGSNRFLETCR